MKDTDRDVEPSIQSRFTFAPIEEFAKILDSTPDPPGYYHARLDLAHLSLMSGFDELICLDQLRIDRYWYQIETVRKVLKYFRGRVLLADEVGLGKTIEAGMLLKEYMLRGLVRRTLVLVPPALVSQWREELLTKFDIVSRTTDDVNQKPTPAFWRRQGVVVASINLAKSKTHTESVTRSEWDLVIVDEAHHLKNRSTLNWKLVNSLKKRFIFLLTATPVQNNLIELYNLLTLLMPGVLKTEAQFKKEYVLPGNPRMPKNPESLRSLLQEVMVRNIRSVVDVKLPRRYATTVIVEPSPREKELYEAISAFLRSHFHEEKGLDRLTLNTLLRMAGSSPQAVVESIVSLRERFSYPELGALAELARSVDENRKAQRLLEIVRAAPGKVLVFAHFVKTLDFLCTVLTEGGIPFSEFRGDMSNVKKDESIRKFRDDVNVLLASETGGEGRNLQFCQTLINFDLPWNPMRIEQRIGRIHRIGQTKDVFVFNFCIKGSIEEGILRVLHDKINMFELVVGEIDSIVGNLDSDQDFSQVVLDLWLKATSESHLREEFDTLGDQLLQAKSAYEESKRLDETLFSEEFEV